MAEDDSGPLCHRSNTRRLAMAVSQQRLSPSNGIFSWPWLEQQLFLAQVQINQQLHFQIQRWGAGVLLSEGRETSEMGTLLPTP